MVEYRDFTMTKNFFVKQAALLLGMFFLTAVFFYVPIFSKISITISDGWNEWSGAIFFKRWISQGVFPLWNPDVGFGTPEWTAINPLALHQLLLFLLPPEIVWNLVKVLNFVLSGWFLSLYLLRRLKTLFPAFLGGLIGAVAQLNVDIAFASYFLFVLSFLLADRFVNLRTYSAGLVFAGSFFVFCLSALPQPVLCAALFLFSYIAVHFGLHRNFNFRLWLTTLFPFVMVLLFFSPQILRVKEALDLSDRANVANGEVFSVFPWEYLHLFWPHFLLNSQDLVVNVIPGRMIAALQNYLSNFVNVRFSAFSYYGIFSFFAVSCLFFKRNLKPFEKTLLWILIFFILAAPILNPLFYPIMKRIPVLGLASTASLFGAVYITVLLLFVSILAAISLGYLSNTKISSEFNLGRIKKLFIGFAVFVILVSLFRLLIYTAFHFKSDPVRAFLSRWLIPLFSSKQFHQAPEFYAQRIAQAIHFLELWSSPRNVYFYIPVFLILSSMAILYGRLTEKIGKASFFIACFGLLMLDAKIFHPMSFHAPQDLAPLREEADFIKKDKTIFRVMALQDGSPEAADARANDMRNVILRPESQLIYGLSSPECLRSVIIKDFNDYMRRMTVEGGTRGRLVGEIETIRDASLLDLANIKYLIAPLSKGADAFPPDRYEHVYQTARCNIFRNKFSKERAFFLSPQTNGSVTVEQYSPHRIRLKVRADSPDELVLTDQYYPGWNAFVDGIPTPITKFQGTFRKIAIPSGQHTIEFKFQPTYLSYSIFLPLLGVILVLGCLFKSSHEESKIIENK
ncbi:MAG: hypothetical protein A3A81_01325 [Omnitrophica bacterium RIFCSPLOWO2_01_FULL_45_10b]|nr:MAG: hypothetical protein A3A81_01325 [Omnitrophica bacterium RIFCSPLOWO2_01_FULL_45_10b]